MKIEFQPIFGIIEISGLPHLTPVLSPQGDALLPSHPNISKASAAADPVAALKQVVKHGR